MRALTLKDAEIRFQSLTWGENEEIALSKLFDVMRLHSKYIESYSDEELFDYLSIVLILIEDVKKVYNLTNRQAKRFKELFYKKQRYLEAKQKIEARNVEAFLTSNFNDPLNALGNFVEIRPASFGDTIPQYELEESPRFGLPQWVPSEIDRQILGMLNTFNAQPP